jgi:hypothetical protein
MIRERVHLLIAAGLLLCLGLATAAIAQGSNQAALVISLEDGEVITRCVEFVEDELTGYELLSRSGLTVDASATGFGVTVCRIQESGCPSDDCFCQCKGGADCIYWSYWHVRDDEWRYSQAGAAVYPVKHGDIEGWVWDVGSPNEAPPPPSLSFEQICSSEASGAFAPEPTSTEISSSSGQNVPEAPGEAVSVAAASGLEQQTPGPVGRDDQGDVARWLPYAIFILLAVVGAVLLLSSRRPGGEA